MATGRELARISHHGHGLRGAVRPTGQERRAARCGASGKRLDAPCRPESAALRVAPRRPPAASRASTVVPATLFGPLLADRTPGRDAGRDPGEICGLEIQNQQHDHGHHSRDGVRARESPGLRADRFASPAPLPTRIQEVRRTCDINDSTMACRRTPADRARASRRIGAAGKAGNRCRRSRRAAAARPAPVPALP